VRRRSRRRAPGSRPFRWFWGPSVPEDVDDELGFHLDMRERELIAAGMDPEAARARARELFGDVDRVRHACREMGERRARFRRLLDGLAGVRQDARYALRALRRGPAFALSAILMLALGIGANSTLFALVDAIVLRPLPGVRDVDSLVELSSQSISYPAYRDFRDGNPAFAGVAAFSQRTLALADSSRSVLGAGTVVSGNFFAVLGARAAHGRLLEPSDDNPSAPSVVVVSDAFWRRFLGGDPAAVGGRLMVNGRGVTIVGVAVPGFTGARIGAPEVWMPIHVWPRVAPLAFGTVNLDMRTWSWLRLVGRLAPGVGLAQAEAALNIGAAAQRAANPGMTNLQRLTLVPAVTMATGVGGRDGIVGFFALLAAVVGLVLLITCANVANLLLARSAGRRREIAVRLAIGASRGRLVRQLLSESLVLALAACALGVGLTLLATWLVDGTAIPGQRFQTLALAPDWRVLAFAVAVSLATGVGFGLAPALQATRVDLVPGLKGAPAGGGARSRLRGALLVGQVALSLVLLVGAGLFARALQRALSIDPGFRHDQVAMVHADPGLARHDGARAAEYYAETTRRALALPGVAGAGWTTSVPLTDDENTETVDIEGYTARADEQVGVELSLVGSGLLGVLRIPVLRGRGFDDRDRRGAQPVAIVNETLAARYFPDGDALGKRMHLVRREVVIVGIARDLKYHALREEPRPYVYLPLAQQLDAHPFLTEMTLLVRARVPPATLLPALLGELRATASDVPVYQAGILSDVLATLLMPQRVGATLLGLFSLLAMLLAALGVFGAVAYGVSQRVREIGIRMALGARSADVLRLVLGRSLRDVAIGVALGLGLAAAGARAAEGFLYGIAATDLPTYAATSAILLAVSLLAAYVPARAATRTNPAITLQSE